MSVSLCLLFCLFAVFISVCESAEHASLSCKHSRENSIDRDKHR